VNAPLAKHYGFSGVTTQTYQKVQYPGRRAGLLMLGGVIAAHDKINRTSIVRRGLNVRTQVLCQLIPAPPPNIPPLGPIDQNQSQADRLAAHRTNATCAACHKLMDPIGQVFENVDAVGRDRTVDEAGRPVKTAGELKGTVDSDGPVADGAELVTRLSQSSEVRDCMALQVYRFSMGRGEEDADACSRGQLRARFKKSGSDLRELFVGVTQTDDFLYRAATSP
jgi:hypothetical protein